MSASSRSSRRRFLSQSAAAASTAFAPYFFSTKKAWSADAAAKSDLPVIGCIGTGSRGTEILGQAKQYARIAAVCDVDAGHARNARQAAGGKAKIFDDYRCVLDRDDIQAVTIVTPDHWHTKIAVEAMQAGKDVYCEKPLTLTIDEGKIIGRVARETGRIFQVGTQQRSEFDLRFLTAVALVRSGRLGKLQRIQCAIGAPPTSPSLPVVQPPQELNWERWLGQTPLVAFRMQPEIKDDKGAVTQPYHSRCHYEFRWWYEYSGGKLTDWGAHHVDIATWAAQLHETGPAKVRVLSSKHPVPMVGGNPTLDDRYNTATEFHVVAEFPGLEIAIRHDTDNGILFEGDQGRIFVNRDKIAGKPVEELKDNPLPEDALVQVYKGKQPTAHMANFFDCLKSREEPISDVWSHHRALSTCHLANIALRLNREIAWDPVKEEIVGDEEAQSMVSRPQRKGYEIKA